MEEQKNIMDSEGKKVELYIKREANNAEQYATIDFGNIFHNMGQKKRIYAFLLAICFILGAAIPLFFYQVQAVLPSAVSIINFNSDDAKSHVNDIKSSYVLQKALSASELSESITVNELASNISIKGILTDEAMQQLEALGNLTETDSKYYEVVSSLQLSYGNRYLITLSNAFGIGEKVLKDTELEELLKNTVAAFEDYLFETYGSKALPYNKFDSVDLESLDYIETLQLVDEALDYWLSYSSEKAQAYPNFKSSSDGMSFDDIVTIINATKSVELDSAYSNVYYNHYTKDCEALISKYSYNIRQAEYQLQVANETLEEAKQNLENYKNEKLVILSGDGQLSSETVMTTEYYNDFVLNIIEINEKISSIKKTLSDYNDTIEWYKDSTHNIADQRTIDEISELIEKCNSIYKNVRSYSEELIASDCYKYSYIEAMTVMEEGSHLSDAAKKAVIGCVIGLIIGFAIWFADGFAVEMKKNGNREQVAAKN